MSQRNRWINFQNHQFGEDRRKDLRSQLSPFDVVIFGREHPVRNMNKTAGYHRHILLLPIFLKKAFKKMKTFFSRKNTPSSYFSHDQSFLIFCQKNPIIRAEKTFSWNNTKWYAFYSKFANFSDFEKIHVFFAGPAERVFLHVSDCSLRKIGMFLSFRSEDVETGSSYSIFCHCTTVHRYWMHDSRLTRFPKNWNSKLKTLETKWERSAHHEISSLLVDSFAAATEIDDARPATSEQPLLRKWLLFSKKCDTFLSCHTPHVKTGSRKSIFSLQFTVHRFFSQVSCVRRLTRFPSASQSKFWSRVKKTGSLRS